MVVCGSRQGCGDKAVGPSERRIWEDTQERTLSALELYFATDHDVKVIMICV